MKFKNYALILGQPLGVAWYGKRKWWQDGFHGQFRRVNEKWFGQHTYAGGTDKAVHFCTNYVFSRLMASSSRTFGNDPHPAAVLGVVLTLGTMTAVEILDGCSKTWHFSREDAAMNLLGAGSAFLLEKHPHLDELVDLRLAYQPSATNEKGFDPAGDYSGQTYLLVLKASGIPALGDHRLLRYVEFAAGYSARNYDRRARRIVDTALEYVQVPGTAAYGRHQLSTK